MTTHNAENERIKRRYFAYLKEAKRHSEPTVDAVAKALARFEADTRHRDFKAFHFEQAIAFKKRLAEQKGQRSGEKLSKATLHATLAHVKRFFHWLAGQPGYKSRLQYSDADYFNLSEKVTCFTCSTVGPTCSRLTVATRTSISQRAASSRLPAHRFNRQAMPGTRHRHLARNLGPGSGLRRRMAEAPGVRARARLPPVPLHQLPDRRPDQGGYRSRSHRQPRQGALARLVEGQDRGSCQPAGDQRRLPRHEDDRGARAQGKTKANHWPRRLPGRMNGAATGRQLAHKQRQLDESTHLLRRRGGGVN